MNKPQNIQLKEKNKLNYPRAKKVMTPAFVKEKSINENKFFRMT